MSLNNTSSENTPLKIIGNLEIRDEESRVNLSLDGTNGNISVGGEGQDGTVSIKNSEGQTTIQLDGSTGEITIKDWKLSVPDYVFGKDYKLKELDALRDYIDKNRHLPGVPPAKEITGNGINIGGLNMMLLEKIEELSLYILQQDNTLKQQENRLKKLEQALGIETP